MDIHLSDETARYVEARRLRGGYQSPSDFLEDLLRQQRQREADHAAGQQGWPNAQQQVAASIWDNDADARYDAL